MLDNHIIHNYKLIFIKGKTSNLRTYKTYLENIMLQIESRNRGNDRHEPQCDPIQRFWSGICGCLDVNVCLLQRRSRKTSYILDGLVNSKFQMPMQRNTKINRQRVSWDEKDQNPWKWLGCSMYGSANEDHGWWF